jgi:hypothetical protein
MECLPRTTPRILSVALDVFGFAHGHAAIQDLADEAGFHQREVVFYLSTLSNMRHVDVTFHPAAAKRFDELGDQLRSKVRKLTRHSSDPNGSSYTPYPIKHIVIEDTAAGVSEPQSISNPLGVEVGKWWVRDGQDFGLPEEAYQEALGLAKALEKTDALKGKVGALRLVTEICKWLQRPEERLTTLLAQGCRDLIEELEIWVPLFRVHAVREFSIGEVIFRPITPAFLEPTFGNEALKRYPDTGQQRLRQIRMELQGHLAACVNVTAERSLGQLIARERAEEAVALLRFLSPANWVLGHQSYCVPLGRERIEIGVELFVRYGKFNGGSEAALNRAKPFWNVEKERDFHPGLIESLDDLSRNRITEFRRELLNAMLQYARNSISALTSDKLVFVLVSLESLLLKDGSEPITKNIGERMAFLVGQTVGERKAVIKCVTETYQVRSKFIHHGETVDDSVVVERFFELAWQCLRSLLHRRNDFKTKAALIEELENRKLA